MNIQKSLVGQFHQPHGLLGRVAGWVMATRSSNLERNRWTVDLLGVGPEDDVLELGPGPGVTLSLMLSKGAHVTAVDHSQTMLALCRKRNSEAIKAGNLTLVESSFAKLDYLGKFDKIVAVNSLQFDAMNLVTFKRIVSLLRPGGSIAVTFQPRSQQATTDDALTFGDRIAELLREAGIDSVQVERLDLEPVCAVCVLGCTGR